MQVQSGCPRDSQLLPHANPAALHPAPIFSHGTTKRPLYYYQLATPAIAAAGHSSKVIQLTSPQVSIPRSSPALARPSTRPRSSDFQTFPS